MRVLLVGPDLESNLSLRYLASSLRAAEHEPRIATFDCLGDAPAVVAAAAGFELVGLSMCFQVRAPEFLALARSLKAAEPGRPVIAGGHFASCAALELLEHHPELDVIVIHEGEQAIVELANLGKRVLADAHTLRGLAVRSAPLPGPLPHGGEGTCHLSGARPILDDLDLLPEPDRAGPARLLAGVPTAYLMGSRGCVNACDYCCITTLHRLAPGKRFRQRSPERVAFEMAGLYHQRGVRQFVFHDDNFLVPSYAHNQARIGRLEAALEEHDVEDVALVLKCSPRDAERRILSRLKELGLIRIFMGIESGTQCGLDAIGRKQTVAEAERALTLCEELDVSSQYTLITFHPEASPESMLADLAFARRHPAHPLNYCRAEVYAGTPLEKRLLDAGRAIGDFMGRVYRYTDPRVERVWDLGKDLFAGRCWGKDEILGQAIRLDHQVTVVRHFYEGAAVQKLTRGWRELQVELNLGTADLFAELVELCASETDEGRVSRARADLERRERKSRAALMRRLCELRADVEACTRVALPAALRPPSRRRPRVFSSVVPRHAAAVAVALGLAGYAPGAGAQDSGKRPAVTEKKKKPPDAGVSDAIPVAPQPFQVDHGVAEAAPPPYDRYRIDHGVAEAAPPPFDEQKRRRLPPPPPPPPPPRDAGSPRDFIIDHGVAEAAPPPYDRYRIDHGVAEAAPPPIPVVQGWANVIVVAGELTVYLSNVGKVSGNVALQGDTGPLTFTVNGKTDDRLFKATLTRRVSAGRVQLSVEAEPKVKVLIDGRDKGETPHAMPVQRPGQRITLDLVEPASSQRLRLILTVGG